MSRPALSYPVSLDPLSDFYTLSPWSLAEIARRFGLGRSNLMGLLRGERTVSNDKLMALLRWSGLEVVNGTLQLAPGLQVWRVASVKHLEAFARLPAGLQPEDGWDLVTEADHPRREWIHLWSQSRDARQFLLSVRPDFYPLLRDRWPGLGRHDRLRHFAEGRKYDEIAGRLGGEHLYIPSEEGSRLCIKVVAPHIGMKPEISEWARWLRQSLHLDTSPWLIPEVVAEETQGGKSSPLSTSVHPEACQHAWTALTHRLDTGETHTDICNVPVFSLGEMHPYPIGMVRLDRSFLGEKAMEFGKARRLRVYKEENTGVLWLVVMNSEFPCGLPDAFFSNRIGDFALVLQGESLVVGRIAAPGQSILGRVLSRMGDVQDPACLNPA